MGQNIPLPKMGIKTTSKIQRFACNHVSERMRIFIHQYHTKNILENGKHQYNFNKNLIIISGQFNFLDGRDRRVLGGGGVYRLEHSDIQ